MLPIPIVATLGAIGTGIGTSASDYYAPFLTFASVMMPVKKGNEDETGNDATALNDADRAGRSVASAEFIVDEGGRQDTEGNDKADHSATAPGILGSGPGASEEEASQRRDSSC